MQSEAVSTGHVGSATANSSALVEEASMAKGMERPCGLTMWELPLRRPEGLERLLGF